MHGLYIVNDTARAHAPLGWFCDLCAASDLPEYCRLVNTLIAAMLQILAWRAAGRPSNGRIEGINNLIKRVKRAASGFRRFANYRIRALLYAGKPNWALLATLTPR